MDDATASPRSAPGDHPTPEEPWAEEVVAEVLERIGRGLVEAAETAVGLGVLGVNRVNALRSRATQAPRDGGRGDQPRTGRDLH